MYRVKSGVCGGRDVDVEVRLAGNWPIGDETVVRRGYKFETVDHVVQH